MSKWGKRKQSYASDGDSDDHAPSKKSSMKDSDDPDNIIVCEISRNRRVSVRNWQGKVQVDIREFYVKDGKQMPGKKGNILYDILCKKESMLIKNLRHFPTSFMCIDLLAFYKEQKKLYKFDFLK
ncbi:hypothetical protein PVL29_027178 [Vitis rotundifolia]|uniref:Transcriptional coactivator p15 (PC4) C-terminal domain-containing protein n=1 Tax=Vitis rotundifolia TaxID=103349 RepID=A0AA38YII0_VITRO|nr:hypothetical protein PVL29_027178 [Vitis rotundifolia]